MAKHFAFFPKEIQDFRKNLLSAGKNIENHWIAIGDTWTPERPKLKKSEAENSNLKEENRGLKGELESTRAVVAEHAVKTQKLTSQLDAAHKRHAESEERRRDAVVRSEVARLRGRVFQKQRDRAREQLKTSQAQAEAHAQEKAQLQSDLQDSHNKHAATEGRLNMLQGAATKTVKTHGVRGIVTGEHRRSVRALRQHVSNSGVHQLSGLFIANIDTCD